MLQVYNIRNNQITGSAFMGTVGLDRQFSGIGNFSGAGTSDMLLRNSNAGGLHVSNISNKQITGSAFIGAVANARLGADVDRSGRTEARTGLRMMPTSPRSPLSFRTAGFPQYGWKAGLSDGAFPIHRPT